MSIASEISRLSSNISDSLDAVAAKGVTVPSDSNSDDLPGLIALIEQGSGSDSGGTIYQDTDGYLHLSEDDKNVISIVDTLDTAGGTIRTITSKVESGAMTMERGSFIATTADSLTIPVSALYSHIYIYHSTITANTDLTDAPYGTYKRIAIYADNNIGFHMDGIINYAGTGFSAEMSRIGAKGWPDNPTGANSIVFSNTSIMFTTMRYNGTIRTFIDGDTYYWEAW